MSDQQEALTGIINMLDSWSYDRHIEKARDKVTPSEKERIGGTTGAPQKIVKNWPVTDRLMKFVDRKYSLFTVSVLTVFLVRLSDTN